MIGDQTSKSPKRLSENFSALIYSGGSTYNILQLDEVPVVCYYFSANWCPPCKNFCKALKKFYEKINSENKRFEVIFVSCDSDNSQFEKSFETMPWLALDYDDPMRLDLVDKLQIISIPELLLISPNKSMGKSCKNDFEKYGEGAYEIWLGLTKASND